jgi:hypothetical protein
VTQVSDQIAPSGPATPVVPAGLLARRLAAAGLGVQVTHRAGTCELAIAGVARGKSLVALEPGGQARWYYEPAAGAASTPAALTAIIAYLLNAPSPASLAAYQALPLKGQAGRALQDQGLTVVLRVSEDLESFEATTDIEVTSPAWPQLGAVTLSDDAALDWHLDWRAAFRGDPAALIDVITPVLRASHTGHRPG